MTRKTSKHAAEIARLAETKGAATLVALLEMAEQFAIRQTGFVATAEEREAIREARETLAL